MTACRLTAILLGLFLLLAVHAGAQSESGSKEALTDSSSIVTLKDGTSYSKDTLAMVYLHRLYARKPKEAAVRTTFAGERSERTKDSAATSTQTWKKWKKDEVAEIAAIEDFALRDREAAAFLKAQADKRARTRRLCAGLGFTIGCAGGVLLYLADRENRQTNEDIEEAQAEILAEGGWPLYDVPRADVMSATHWIAYGGSVVVVTALISAFKGKEERAYKSYMKEKGILPKIRFTVMPVPDGGTEARLQLSLAID